MKNGLFTNTWSKEVTGERNEPPLFIQKSALHLKNVMPSVWCHWKDIVYYGTFQSQALNSDTYYSKLNRLNKVKVVERLELANRKSIFFNHDLTSLCRSDRNSYSLAEIFYYNTYRTHLNFHLRIITNFGRYKILLMARTSILRSLYKSLRPVHHPEKYQILGGWNTRVISKIGEI